jgi:L-iditol 2-dehydrogenase
MIKAAVMPAPGRAVEIREFPEPELEPGSALFKTIYSEVCGTDIHVQDGKLSLTPYPLIPGHANVGILEAIEGDLKDVEGNPLGAGQVVTFFDVHKTCNNCWYCLVAKAPTRCPNRKVYGITYGAEEGLLGGWSEVVYLKPGVRVLRLPEGVEPLTFIAGGCALPTAFHAMERGDMRLGDTVAVQGAGPVGLMCLAFAQMAGASKTIILGNGAPRLKAARDFGADVVIDIDGLSPKDRVEAVLGATGGRGADLTVEATGAPQAIIEGMEMTRDAGRYVVVGQYTDLGDVLINPHRLINRKHLEVRGCWGIEFGHLYKSVQLLPRLAARFPLAQMVTRTYSLTEANEALADVRAQRVVKAAIAPNGPVEIG